MGILGSAEVIECSVSDLVGQYVGHTGPKTKKLFEKALGKVLFIDEAYRLSQGRFAQEAIDELVGLITHPTFKSKLVVVLAGYEQDMNNLMSVNAGLSSRFPDQIVFTNMEAGYCLEVLLKELTKKNVRFSELEDNSSLFYRLMEDLVKELASLPDWGNARDMVTLSKELINKALLDSSVGKEIQVARVAALKILKKMVDDRRRRSNIPLKASAKSIPPERTFTVDPSPPPPTAAPVAETSFPSSTSASQAPRGAGTWRRNRRGRQVVQQVQLHPNVSDAVLNPLQAATQAKEESVAETSFRSSTPASQAPQGAGKRRRSRRGLQQVQRDPNASDAVLDPLQAATQAKEESVAETSFRSSTPASQAPQGAGTWRRSSGGVVNRQAVQQVQRDPNVSDEVWNSLQEATQAKEEAEQNTKKAIKSLEDRIATHRKNEVIRKEEFRKSQQKEAEAKDAHERESILREREWARLKEQGACRAHERVAAELRAKKEAERIQREQEEKAQRKLRELGVCPAGYPWINMSNGYRCTGGTHFVSASQLGL